MAEFLLAWICILAAVYTENPLWAIASALFAIAMHFSDIKKLYKKGDADD